MKIALVATVAVVLLASSLVSAKALDKMLPVRASSNSTAGGPNSVVEAMSQVFCSVFSRAGVAGIVGNAVQESSLNPTIRQYGGGPGRGLFQMSEGGLWNVCQQYCAENGCDYWSAEGQSAFVKATIVDPTWANRAYGTGVAAQLYSALQSGSVDATTSAFMSLWERCGDCQTAQRQAYAREWYPRINC